MHFHQVIMKQYYEATKNKAFFVMAITEESNGMLLQKAR
jgi:hypothetical protein